MTYENALQELQIIMEEMENQQIDMDHLLPKVKRAKYLVQFCQDKLRNVEKELQNEV